MSNDVTASSGTKLASDYYVIERGDKPHRGDSQWKVGEIIRKITREDWAVGYYNYPFQPARNEFDESPDIVFLHADIGLIVITCRGYSLDDIKQVTTEDWEINEGYDRPVPEAQEQLAHVQSQLTGVADLIDFRDHGELVDAVALPNISRSEWNSADFPELNVTLLFSEDCKKGSLKETLMDATGEVSIPDSLFKKARKRLNQGDILSADRDPIRENELTNKRSHLYRSAARGFELHEQDKIQEKIGLHIPPGPQQIRGIAGSGKTTIMAKKAAVMHLNNPDWDIAFTFNTRSLYQTIENSITEFYRDFSNGQDPDDNLNILHGWGQKAKNAGNNEQAEGLYRKIAMAAGHTPYQVNTSGFTPLNVHCAHLLNSDDEIPELFDAILIDEAQDFDPAFYRMCYDSLKEPKRLIWAYDEAQSLNKLSAPSPKIIFHESDAEHRSVDLSGFYEGRVRKSFIMRQSYRTPRDILMAAHALGMGLYREEGIVHTLTKQTDWDAIGYTVSEESSFNETGSEIEIWRDRDLSPHPLQSRVDSGDLFSYSFHSDYNDEALSIAERVINDIVEEDLDPSQIMVVCIGPYDYSGENISYARNVRKSKLFEKINELGSDRLDDDSLAHSAEEGSRDEFWKEGKVTVSNSNRAKGNEAASVYIAGAEQISKENWKASHENSKLRWRDNYVQIRNEAFVGLTRSEGWCHISGVGDTSNTFLNEIEKVENVVSNEKPKFVFDAPKPSEMTGEIRIDETVPKTNAHSE